jgi:hypothetical protein
VGGPLSLNRLAGPQNVIDRFALGNNGNSAISPNGLYSTSGPNEELFSSDGFSFPMNTIGQFSGDSMKSSSSWTLSSGTETPF